MQDANPAPRRHKRSTPVTAAERKLLELASLPESHLTADEIRQLDAFVAAGRREVQAKWTARDEASRRGVDLRRLRRDMTLMHDGRLFQSGVYRVQTVDTAFVIGEIQESILREHQG